MRHLTVGTRVRLALDIDRFPYFTAKAGATGIVVAAEPALVAVKLDEKIVGAEDWDNEVHWDGDLLPSVDAEVEPE